MRPIATGFNIFQYYTLIIFIKICFVIDVSKKLFIQVSNETPPSHTNNKYTEVPSGITDAINHNVSTTVLHAFSNEYAYKTCSIRFKI